MRKLLFATLLLTGAFSSRAQLAMYGGLEDVYRNFMVQSHTQFNKSILNDFTGVGGDSRFYSNTWLIGGATNNFEVTISDNYTFNYDFLGHELHAKWKDTSIVVNTNYVKRFFLLNNGRPRYFVKSPALNPAGNYFYESLAFDEESNDSAKVQLLKFRNVKQLKSNKNDYLANFSGEYSDKLDNDIEYYIVFPDKTSSKVKLSKKSISEALAKHKQKVDYYFKQPTGAFTEDVAAGLIRYINQ